MKIKEFFLSMINFTSGCTEPAAIALNAANAREVCNLNEIKRIILKMDYLTYKNAYYAGIPNAPHYKGTLWAYLLGYAVGDPSAGLEIFSRIGPDTLTEASELAESIPFEIEFIESNTLYIKSLVITCKKIFSTVTRQCHSSVSQKEYIISDFDTSDINEIIYRIDKKEIASYSAELERTSGIDDSYYKPSNWASLVDELYSDREVREKVEEGIEANILAHEIGRKDWDTTGSDFGTGSAIYARMSGKPIKVMACANSGNKGLTSIVPTVNYCRERNIPGEEMLKSVITACFVNSIITVKFGFISSICGVVYGAGAGFLAAIMKIENQLDDFDNVFINYISNFGGIFCDGAKVSCAMKGNIAIQAAITAKRMHETGLVVDYHDGYLGRTFHETLNNLMKYNDAMKEMDKITVSILENKP